MIDHRFLLFPLLAATLYGCASGSQGGWSSGAGSNVGAGSFTLAPGESRSIMVSNTYRTIRICNDVGSSGILGGRGRRLPGRQHGAGGLQREYGLYQRPYNGAQRLDRHRLRPLSILRRQASRPRRPVAGRRGARFAPRPAKARLPPSVGGGQHGRRIGLPHHHAGSAAPAHGACRQGDAGEAAPRARRSGHRFHPPLALPRAVDGRCEGPSGGLAQGR